MRLSRVALGIVLLVPVGAVPQNPQTQHQIDLPHFSGTNFPQINVGTGKVRVPYIPSEDAMPALWLKQRSADLFDLLGCYLDQQSLANEVSAELKNGGEPMNVIETRIKLLKTLARKNVASHCK